MPSDQSKQKPLSFHSRAPANTMITGEHSVVYGEPAIACSLEQWLDIYWMPISVQEIQIMSALADFSTPLNELNNHPKLEFVCHALQHFSTTLQAKQHGWKLIIHSEFSSTIGLGSSAAVLAATLVGLNHLNNKAYTTLELWKIGKQIITDIQGRGSATDLAASLFGGLVYFQPPTESKALQIDSITAKLNILLIYSGYKTPTAEVLAMVEKQWRLKPKELANLYQTMGKITQQAYQAIKAQNQNDFAYCLQKYQQQMVSLGVSDQTLEQLINWLTSCPNVIAAKISGSGLGDCVLAVGDNQCKIAKAKKNPQTNQFVKNCPQAEQLADYFQLQLPLSSLGAHIAPGDSSRNAL